MAFLLVHQGHIVVGNPHGEKSKHGCKFAHAVGGTTSPHQHCKFVSMFGFPAGGNTNLYEIPGGDKYPTSQLDFPRGVMTPFGQFHAKSYPNIQQIYNFVEAVRIPAETP